MSCNCNASASSDQTYVCVCDAFSFPDKLQIDAGLTDLPRQIAGFSEYRRALLRAVGSKDALTAWRASGKEDLGIMLLEMWCYIADSLSFYDVAIAQESYLRTSKLRSSLRKLVALLGYLPAPALGSRVQLAVMADGRLPVIIPQGTAIRSLSSADFPSQVFELEEAFQVHPFNNKWTLALARGGKITTDNPAFLLIQVRADIKPYSLLILLDYDDPSAIQVLRVKKLEPYTTVDGTSLTKLYFQSAPDLAAGTTLDRLWLLIPEPNSTMYNLAIAKEADDMVLYQSIIDKDIHQAIYLVRPGSTSTTNYIQLALGLAVATAGDITDEAMESLFPTDNMVLSKRAEQPPPEYLPTSFSLFDKNSRGVLVNGNIDFPSGSFLMGQGETWAPALTGPVDIYGNIIPASRGESILNEILGNGDATMPGQVFKLQKSPLTYFQSGTQGAFRPVQNTLQVSVNGILWKEVPSFYGIGEQEEVYIVRQNDDQESQVIFGDGARGKRVPSGINNITANYRYGAGAVDPPADSITQVQSDVTGLQNITNPLPAAGGNDAETEAVMRTTAPKSVLILGRAVSIDDIGAVALTVPGVRAAQATWRWHPGFQTAAVHIWYIGEDGIETLLIQQLRSLTDPTVPIAVEPASPVPVTLQIDLAVNERYDPATVSSAVFGQLTNTDDGMLAPENIGIGVPLFRSRLFKEILAVEGTVAVNNMIWNNQSLTDFGLPPGDGAYFYFSKGALTINGIS